MSVQFGGGAGGGNTTVTVNVVNSGAIIFISGQCVCISGQPVNISGDLISFASGATANLSGLNVAGNFNVAANVSGNVVYLSNDGTNNVVRISGQPVSTSVSGNSVNASVSGNVVSTSVSGNVVAISGSVTTITSVSGNVISTSVSGNNVATSVSGNVLTNHTQAFDPSGVVWNDVWVNTSGQHRLLTTISGDVISVSGTVTIAGAVTTSISGNIVSVSGPVPVTTSVSGNVLSTSISGNVVAISGSVTTITSVSGNVISTSVSGNNVSTSVSGNIVSTSVSGNVLTGHTQIFDPSGVVWNDAWANASGQHRLMTTISGDVVAISGTVTVAGAITTSVSGNVVAVSGSITTITSVSGNVVSISGSVTTITSISGNAVKISGETVYPVSSQGFTYIWDYSGLTWTKAATDTSGSSKLNVNASVVASADISGQTVRTFSSPAFTYLWDYSGLTWTQAAVDTSGSNKLSVNASVTANISGQAVRNSGQTIYPVSGQSFGFIWDYSGLTWTQAATSNSGTNKLLVDAGSISANVSGNVVYLSNDNVNNVVAISGSIVKISGQAVTTSVSGNVISTSISGNVVALSGTATIQGAVTTSVSGNIVTDRIQAFDPSGVVLNDIWVNASGQHRLMVTASGDVVSISGTATIQGAVTTSVSGNAVSTSVSGNVVAVSGSVTTITSISGNVVSVSGSVTTITSISGNVVSVSGLWTSTTLQSGQVGVSGAAGVLNFMYDYSGLNWAPIPAANSGVRIPRFTASGDSFSTSISGNVVAISGSVTTITSVSGNVVSISGTAAVSTSISGNVVSVSGLWTSTTLQSGQYGVSGAAGTLNFAYDYSGLNWVPWPTMTSGVRIPVVSVSGQSVVTSVSGNVISVTGGGVSVSGNVISISGTATIAGTVSIGNVVPVSGLWTSITLQSGQYGVSGAAGTMNFAYDYSGLNWVPWPTSNSGVRIPVVTISGNAVSTSVSGNVISVTGGGVSISGNVVSISGTAAVSVTNIVPVSGLWTSTTLQSGQYGVSGAAGTMNFAYDYSGLNWVPWPTMTSGIRIPVVSVSGQTVVTSVSGNVISVTGGGVSVSGNMVGISGSVTTITSVSGNVVKPTTPTFINAIESFRISVASGGVQLSSFTPVVACTVRNIGNSGDVVFVGSLSSPPYMGTSGQAWPAISGKGFWLRDGDAITLNTTDTANIKVTANLSGTPVSYIAIG